MKRRPLPPMTTTRANGQAADYLVNLAGEINRAHERAKKRATEAISYGRDVGRLLIQAKEHVGHGKFEAWVEKNCDFGARMAQKYMRAAEHWDLVDVEATVSEIDIRLRSAKAHSSSLLAEATADMDPEERDEFEQRLQAESAKATSERQQRVADRKAKQADEAPQSAPTLHECPKCGYEFISSGKTAVELVRQAARCNL